MDILTKSVFVLFLAINLTSAFGQEKESAEVQYPDIQQEIMLMYESDQGVREKAVKMFKESDGEPDMKAFMALKIEQDSIDEANTSRLQGIISEIGWPGPDKVGEKAQKAAFLIVQHSSHEFQEEMLPIIKKQYELGKIEGQSYALLLDRVLVKNEKPQVYGTQLDMQGGDLTFHPIEDSVNVDKRRAEMGMPPLAEYEAKMREMLKKQNQ